jgi:uncharacterized membrane protein
MEMLLIKIVELVIAILMDLWIIFVTKLLASVIVFQEWMVINVKTNAKEATGISSLVLDVFLVIVTLLGVMEYHVIRLMVNVIANKELKGQPAVCVSMHFLISQKMAVKIVCVLLVL